MKYQGKENSRYRMFFILFFLSLSIGDSFNVLFAKRLAEAEFGTGQLTIYISLSCTLMLAMSVTGIFISGALIQSAGSLIRYLVLASLLVFFGMTVCAFADSYWVATGGLMLNGFGFGLGYIGIRYLAFLNTDEEKRLFTLSFVSGGAFVGQCIGTIIGGVLAGQIEYHTVYFIAALLSLLPFLTLIRGKEYRRIEIGSVSEMKEVLRNKGAVLFLIFVVLPIFTSGAFLSYLVPLDVSSFGYSETVVAAMILMEYILAAYLGPYMTRKIHERQRPYLAILLLAILYGAPMLCYCAFRNMWVLLVALLLFGIGDSFGLNMVLETFSETKGNHTYHDNNALIIYILVSRLGITLSPMLLAATRSPLILAVLILGSVSAYCLVRYIWDDKKSKRNRI